MTPANLDLTRAKHKQVTDRAALDALLDDVHVCHVAMVRDGRPVAFPTLFARDGDRLIIHGSSASPWIRAAAAGAEICVTVTSVEGILVARSAFESSMHYRSAMLFGSPRAVEAADKDRVLRLLTDAVLPGRSAEVRPSTTKELAQTAAGELPIESWTLKVSNLDPHDPPDDVAGDSWAGLIPVREVAGEPVPAPDLRDGIVVPDSVGAVLRQKS